MINKCIAPELKFACHDVRLLFLFFFFFLFLRGGGGGGGGVGVHLYLFPPFSLRGPIYVFLILSLDYLFLSE